MSLMKIFCMLLAFSFVNFAHARLKVEKIEILGEKVISESAVRVQLKTKKGSVFKESTVSEDVKRLFKMGYFSYIEAKTKKGKGKNKVILTIQVKEKPRIDSIVYQGSHVLSKKKLEELSQLKKYEFLNIQKLKTGIENIKKSYEEKGYFLTKISYQVRPSKKPQKIKLIINIVESKKSLIKEISFKGNRSLSDKKIKAFLSSKEQNIFSFFTSAGVYKEENILRDTKIIRLLYLEHGFLQVKVDEPVITLSPNKDGIYISFSISEGKSFQVGQIDFAGDLLFSKLELKKGLSLKQGEVFASSRLQQDLQKIQTQYGDKSYAFANVIPRFSQQEGTIHILFHIDKGDPVSIRRINISGNKVTRDKVIRRNVQLAEEDLYQASHILSSKELIQRLGYFEKVDFFNKTLPGEDNKIDLEISLKEREEFGVIQAGGGYNSSHGLMFNGQFTKENFLGMGTRIDIQSSYFPPTEEFLLSFNYLDPHFLDSNWYFGTNFFISDSFNMNPFRRLMKWLGFKMTRPQQENPSLTRQLLGSRNNRGFLISQKGGHITLGRWITKTTKLFGTTGLEDMEFKYIIDSSVFKKEEAEGLRVPITGVWEYDNRNDRLFPSKGFFSNLSLKHTYQKSDSNNPSKKYVQMDAMASYYINFDVLLPFISSRFFSWKNFLSRIVVKNKIQYGSIYMLTQGRAIPFDQLYLLGGPLTLRGFQMDSIGRTRLSSSPDLSNPDSSNKEIPYGGTQQFVYNLELQFPIFGKFYGNVFFDAGYADNTLTAIANNLRTDVGFGFLWVTPMGPMNIKWGFPLKPKANESSYEFQFNLGADF